MNKGAKISIVFLLFILVLTSGFGCKLVSQEVQQAMKPITLEYWSVYDGPDAYDEIFAEYKKLHPFVTINYKKLRYNEYEQELFNALAEDRGPDIFSIHNTWIKKYQNKISPMPDKITMAYPVVKGTLKKEVIPELRTTNSIPLKDIKNNFADVVYKDVVINTMIDEKTKQMKDLVYGLPLSVDTLSLFYNKDLLNNAGIPQAPAYWNREFQQDVKKLTKQDAKGQIEQAGVAMGGGTNITRFSDLLSVLMMQNGTEMMDEAGHVLFDKIPQEMRDQNHNPGQEAIVFYTDFANPSKEVYSWNSTMDNSLDLFIKGKLGFLFGYSYFLPQIQAQAPKLNFAVAPLPQIEGNSTNINFANYWVQTVSKKSKYTNEAWDFVQFMSQEKQAKLYLDKTKKPTALKSLINAQLESEETAVFAKQVLTAKSWYRGKDPAAMEKIFAEMVDNIVLGKDKLENLIDLAARQVQQTIEGGN